MSSLNYEGHSMSNKHSLPPIKIDSFFLLNKSLRPNV